MPSASLRSVSALNEKLQGGIRMRNRLIVTAAVFAACAIIFASAPPAVAATVTLSPSKDNTLYFSATGQWSNGAGQYIFCGRNVLGEQRRAVIAFDLSSIPAG